VFDLARDHLQTLSNQPHRDMSELAFFVELVKGTDFDSKRHPIAVSVAPEA
jgi:hypothetical protein